MPVIDIRETEELEQGKLPGAAHVPRSYLETRIDGVVPRPLAARDPLLPVGQPLGARGADADERPRLRAVESMAGGITLWKDRGYDVEVPRALTPEQRQRYSRHLLLPEVGAEGQQKLLDAKVLLLGAGGLGSPTALYLAAAGVGTLGIVDDDVVDVTNLQRQVIHSTSRVGVPKVDSAEETIKDLNPDVDVVKYATRLDASNIMEIIEGWDIVVDGVDNFPTRYLLNDATVRLQIPVVSAAILGFEGQLSVFKPYEGPCYRCLFRQPPPAELAPSCGANGVLGVLPGTMGLLQATEVVKLILGEGDPLIGRLLMYDALGATFTELKVRRDPECPICSRDPGDDQRRGDGRLPRLRGVLRRRWVGSRGDGDDQDPARAAPLRGRRARGQRRRRQRRRGARQPRRSPSRDPRPALRRRRRAQPLRQRVPQRRGRPRARRALDARRRERLTGHPARDGRRRADSRRPLAPAASSVARVQSTPRSRSCRDAEMRSQASTPAPPVYFARPQLVDEALVLVVEPALRELLVADLVEQDAPALAAVWAEALTHESAPISSPTRTSETSTQLAFAAGGRLAERGQRGLLAGVRPGQRALAEVVEDEVVVVGVDDPGEVAGGPASR